MKRGIQQIRYGGIIADDLTGAADVAATFANYGFTVAVALDPRRLHLLTAEVIALSTNSRHDVPSTARRKVRRACARLREGGLSVLYKKVDSTGQGNIVAEVEAIRDAGGFFTTLVCPANPAQGRTVCDGILHAPGGDALNLNEQFRSQGLAGFGAVTSPISMAKIARVIGERHRFIICDATNERDMECLAYAVLQSKDRVLLAGSAGMAVKLVEMLMSRQSAHLYQAGKLPLLRTGKNVPLNTLVITGSNNRVTERQLAKLIDKTRATSLMLNCHTKKYAAAALASEYPVIIRVPVHFQSDHIISRQLSALTPLFIERLVGSLLLIGGDTTSLVCRCLRSLAIAISGEIVPGLAWGKILGGLADGLPVCTKPGGFGADQSLVRAVDFLARVMVDISSGKTRFRTSCTFNVLRSCLEIQMPVVTNCPAL